MASSSDNISMAVFCDFENVALGVRDANYEKFDIKPVLERLLLKGSIVVKKSYCDWDRYKGFKATMHEANFELIEIPHVRQSGKNSADIRLVVDALDLCYTKSHVNTFVIISGDSDFSPLVSKLRENNKQVIGVGVKQSTSDLLVANCDEFIFYDDLVREVRRAAAKRDERKAQPQPQAKRPPDENNRRKDELEARKAQALEMVVETFDALVSERGDSGKIWASLLKDTLKRRRPDFSETYYGFRTFGNLLEEAQARGLLEFGRDEKSGAYVYRSPGMSNAPANEQPNAGAEVNEPEQAEEAPEQEAASESRRRSRGGRKQSGARAGAPGETTAAYVAPEELQAFKPVGEMAPVQEFEPEPQPEPRRNGRGGRNQPGRRGGVAAETSAEQVATEELQAVEPVSEAAPMQEVALEANSEARRRGRGGRSQAGARRAVSAEATAEQVAPEELQAFKAVNQPAPQAEAPAAAVEGGEVAPQEQPAAKERRRTPRKTAYRTEAVSVEPAPAANQAAPAEAVPAAASETASEPVGKKAKSARKPASRRPAKPKAAPANG